jgi:hypothetical protein
LFTFFVNFCYPVYQEAAVIARAIELEVEYLGERGEATLGGESSGAEDLGEQRDPGRIGVGCAVDKSLRQSLDASREIDPKGAFEQCPVQRGTPRMPERLGFEVDGLGPLDDDSQRTAADGRDADLWCKRR